MIETFSLATFTPLLHTRFQAFPAPDRPVDLELIAADDGGSTPSQERFSLLLQGPLDAFLPQGMYTLTHEQLGTFDLFTTPIEKRSDGFVYQAAFNRLLGEALR